jgi:hypothetical protein
VNLAELLAAAIARLDRAGVPYMITGSVASSYHGEPRATRDLDIVIDPDPAGLDRLVAEFAGAGLYVDTDAARRALADRTQFNAIDATSGWKIHFLIRKDRSFSREEFGRRAGRTSRHAGLHRDRRGMVVQARMGNSPRTPNGSSATWRDARGRRRRC